MPIDRKFNRFQAVLCFSTLVMVAMSWPLWLDQSEFPRVPFFPGIPLLPWVISRIVLAGLLAALGLGTLTKTGRAGLGLSLAFLTFSVVQDQNRLQPWVYQYLVVGLVLATVSRGRALGMARWYTIGLYAYSGLSKLDVSFCRELGPKFLSAAVGPMGLSPDHWPESLRIAAILSMPGFEIILAGLLAFERTRRWGLLGSIVQHVTLIGILGPWNLDHSRTVLAWNLAQIAENLLLFGPTAVSRIAESESPLGWLVILAFGIVMVVPSLERLGYCDAWPAHALYASHAERSDVYIHEDEIERFPAAVRDRLSPPDATPWRRLDLTGWSRDVRGTPLYPSRRIGNAVAEFLETRYGGLQPIRLVQWHRASAWDGRRERDESIGIKAIRRSADRFFVYSHPVP